MAILAPLSTPVHHHRLAHPARVAVRGMAIASIRSTNCLRSKTDFSRDFKPITLVQTFREKYSDFALSEFMIECRRPVSIRGALRGRHGR
ncbi:hypothetical protein [Bradyrhizobium sp. SZCCHNS2096]|uniref:hypothetical protein n=1 Tax=Bradyrhizobium sp. SZCCHNS2096 TaxID=3057309 RepID=UPI002916DA66|nr:hypothetical protein [Bradyrhizobium sp. SZCCHNS2096]